MLMQLLSLLTGRTRAAKSGPASLDGFSKGKTLRLPAGSVLGQEGVRFGQHSDRVTPLSDEAWIAVKLDPRRHFYALWCPYSLRWELLSIEVEPATATRRRFGGSRRNVQRIRA